MNRQQKRYGQPSIWLLLVGSVVSLAAWEPYMHDLYIDDRGYLQQQEFTTRWSGFLRNDLFVNSRQMLDFGLTTVSTIPLEPLCDPLGCDINDVGSFVMTPLRSYIRLDAWGVQCGRFQLHTAYQIDFLGLTDQTASTIRIWNAYMDLFNDTDRLIIGLYRHPFRVLRTFPLTLNFNIAAIAVAPQFRWWHSFTKHVQCMATLYGQLLFTDFGQLGINTPIVSSPEFIQNSGKPGVAFRLQYSNDLFLVGAGIEALQLVPRLQTAQGYATSQSVTAVNGTLYASLDAQDIWLKLQFFLGQDMASTSLVGGYALANCNPDTNACQYAPIPSMSLWFDAEWRKHALLHPGFFLGWSKQLPAREQLYISPVTQQPVFYGLTARLQEVLRVAQRWTLDTEPVRFGIEYEFLRAVWGPMNNRGTTNAPCPVNGGRFLFVSWCDF